MVCVFVRLWVFVGGGESVGGCVVCVSRMCCVKISLSLSLFLSRCVRPIPQNVEKRATFQFLTSTNCFHINVMESSTQPASSIALICPGLTVILS